MANADRIQGKNCFVEVLDSRGSDNVIINVYQHIAKAGEYDQIILPRRKALALGLLLQEEGTLG